MKVYIPFPCVDGGNGDENIPVMQSACLATSDVNDFVYQSPTQDDFVLSSTSNTHDPSVFGLIESKPFPTATTCNVQLLGAREGYSGLSRNKNVYLSVTGGATTVPPTTGDLQILGLALSPTRILFKPNLQKVRLT